MEITVKIELGESAQKAFFALAKVFAENTVEAVTVKNPEIAKMREAVEEGKKVTEKVKAGQKPQKEEPEDVPEETADPEPQEPQTASAYTLDQVRKAFVAKNNAETRPKLKKILDELGVEKITDLQPAQFESALSALEAV